ncbi:MAG: helix-turn-helix transcriptional regulator [Burkholderiaceae bacterium]|nr:helix-turn-helix transcriptional regulator [Burkholderiaceae bacterium]
MQVAAHPAADGPPPVGALLQQRRQALQLSLDELSKRAGVSKSMLSQIERNTANPTVAVLWRLANALGVSLATFLDSAQPATATVAVTPAHGIPVIKSPDGRCELHILGTIELAGKVEWYELTFAPGGVLASEPHESGACEHLSVLSGSLMVLAGDSEKKVKHGETARYPVDVHHEIKNLAKTPAVALLVVEYLS